MRKKFSFILSIFLLLSMVSIASASNILYFNDYVIGTDRMAEALISLAGTHATTTVTSSSDFKTQIETGNYDLGIFMVQMSGPSGYSDGITALGTFVAGGGSAIYTDWTRSDMYAALFGSGWDGSANLDPITVTDPTLAVGLTNPISLTNPGWGVYSMGLDTGTIAATFPDDIGAIVIGMDGRAITNGFLTDTFIDGAQGVQLFVNEIGYALGAPVPEPATMLLLGAGLAGLAGLRRKIKKA